MSRQVGAKRRKYDVSMVNHAAEVVRSGSMTLGEAARAYNIPKSTLHDRTKQKYKTTHIGKKTVLTPEEETRIVNWALHMSKIGYGRTRHELTNVVKAIIDEDGRKTPFVDNRPGRSWMDGFMTRHPNLKLRTTVQLGKERAIINKEKILKWFHDLEEYITVEVGDPGLLKDPTRIYNADESGISLCQTKNRRVLGETGAPVVYQYGNSDKTQMTIMAATSAVGHYVQPMIIFPGQRFSYNPLDGFEEAALGRSENGWMDSEVFHSWLAEVFIPAIESRNVKKPVLLLLDGHKTHITMEASDICVQHGIELYCLLEHSSHLTQPLDLRLFGSLKQSWRQAVREYQSQNVGEYVTKQNFARVFKHAWLKSATVEAAVKGFQDAGIFPMDPQRVISSVKIAPSTVFIESTLPPVADTMQTTYTTASNQIGTNVAEPNTAVVPAAWSPTAPVPAVLPPTAPVPAVLPPKAPASDALPPTAPASGALPPKAPASDALPPIAPVPGALPPTAPASGALPPTAHAPGALPPTAHALGALPPTTPASDALPPKAPASDALPPTAHAPGALPPTAPASDALPPTAHALGALPPTAPASDALPPKAPASDALPPTAHAPGALPPTAPASDALPPKAPASDALPPTAHAPGALPPTAPASGALPPTAHAPGALPPTAPASGALPPTAHAPGALPPTAPASGVLPPAGSAPTSSPFSKYLVIPKSVMKTSKVRRAIMPKAITGTKYREWRQEQIEKKENALREKQQRKEQQILKRERREEELKQKRAALKLKQEQKAEEKRRKKEAKDKKKKEMERIFKEIDASDSDGGIDVGVGKCFKCEKPYDDFLQCCNCFRRFHIDCVADELIVDDLPFECKYC